MRRSCRLSAVVLGLSLLAVAAVTVPDAPKPDKPPAPRVKLAVLLVFDQFRGDYLMRWEKLFGAGGFRRLTGEGAWFQNCHYPYAYTYTGPGHATLATGCPPSKHGVIANDWYDRGVGEAVYCAATERYELVPPRPPAK